MQTRWTSITGDPNSPDALSHRRKQLVAAHQKIRSDRREVISDLCQGVRVLDVGCVDHDSLLNGRNEQWLHHHVVSAAKEAIGVDVDEVGVRLMRDKGYDVIHADITGDISEVEDRGPFDVVVAGEIIEHLGNPQALFNAAVRLLAPGGKMLVTTPNPYAPFRVRSGAFGRVWESVDHVTYSFPSGIVEMADRAGMRLIMYGSEPISFRLRLLPSARHFVGAVYRLLRDQRGDYPAGRFGLPLAPAWTSPMMGYNSIYLLETT
jgi:2-polyprenyl-3-methyl-5-hydroxy-6-metoxy-1,4-benzoquinol methylase